MKSADSAQFASLIGTVVGWLLSNYAPLCGALCALIGTAYTLWKWRREIRKARAEDYPRE